MEDRAPSLEQGPVSRHGRAFYYEYDLTWIDEGRSIAKMILTRRLADESTVAFEGFKGIEREGDRVFYIATSPSGATPVVDDSFITRTYLRTEPEEEWRQIGEDHWTRVPGESSGDGDSHPLHVLSPP